MVNTRVFPAHARFGSSFWPQGPIQGGSKYPVKASSQPASKPRLGQAHAALLPARGIRVRFQGAALNMTTAPYGPTLEKSPDGSYLTTHFKVWAPSVQDMRLVKLKPLTKRQWAHHQEQWELLSRQRWVQTLLNRTPRHSQSELHGNLSGRLGELNRFIQQRETQWAIPTLEARVELELPMERDDQGNCYATSDQFEPGSLYAFRFQGPHGVEHISPDPRSRFQPEEVSGPSQVIDPDFTWSDDWKPIPTDPRQAIIYQAHVGTFSTDAKSFDGESGTFKSTEKKTPYLESLGITHVEFLPIMEFAGNFGFGYDPSSYFAPERAYGNPNECKSLVNTLGRSGIGVLFDNVLNHAGGHGFWQAVYDNQFLGGGGQWGSTFDYSREHVKQFVFEQIRFWRDEYRMSGFRFDMAEKIRKRSEEGARLLTHAANEDGKPVMTFAEDGAEESHITLPRDGGGLGFDGQWTFEWRHIMAAALKNPTPHTLGWAAHVLKNGYKAGKLPDRARGVNFLFTHDVLHNGEGSRHKQSARAKLANALVLLSPGIPLLFMGQEYGEENPFLFFSNPVDEPIIQGIMGGRSDAPDAMFDKDQHFQQSKLSWNKKNDVLNFTKDLIALRKNTPALWQGGRDEIDVYNQYLDRNLLVFRRWGRENPDDEVFVVMNFSSTSFKSSGAEREKLSLAFPDGQWQEVFNSERPEYLSEETKSIRQQMYGSSPEGCSWLNNKSEGVSSHDLLNLPPEGVAIFKRMPS